MPNIIELNLLNNKSIVATMQGIPLANENSYKIIAGEENATIFKVVSVPNQYKDKNFTIEMVNAKNYGINETQIKNISNYEFSLPVGMAVAGYSYILFRCKYTENGKQVVVPFQPLKLKVWNTIPQWQDYVDKTTNVKVVDGYLILTENGNEYNLGYVQGEKGDAGKDGKDHSVEIAEIKSDIADLYLLSNATVTGTEEIKEAYTARQTANGLSGLIDGALTKVLKVEGNTVACHNLVNLEAMKNLALLNNVEIDSNKNTIKLLNDAGGGWNIACVNDENVTAYEKFVKCFGISKAGKYRCTFKSLVNAPTTYWRFNIGATTLFKIGDGKKGTVFEVTQENIDAIKNITSNGNVKLLVYGLTDDVFGEFQIVEGEEEKPYVPYFAGLKNASFKGITSTGRNLISNPSQHISVANGHYDEVVTNVKLLPNTTYCLSFDYRINSSTDENPTCDVGYGDTIMRVSLTPNGVPLGSTSGHFSTTFTTPQSFLKVSTQNPKFVARYVRVGTQGNLDAEVSNIQLTFGDTEQDFTPYEESTIELPTAVESGLGTTIDFENRKIINRGKEIKLQSAVLTEDETANEEVIKSYIGFKYYPNEKHYVLYIEKAIPTVEKRANGVSSYGFVATVDIQQIWTKGALWLGVDNSIVYWLDCADYLGLSSNSTTWANGLNAEPTADEILAVKKAFHTFLQNNPVKIRYISNIPEELPLSTNKSKYKSLVGGSETVVQGTTDNSKYGAENTATNIYAIKKGVTE